MKCTQVQSRLGDLSVGIGASLEHQLREHVATCETCAHEWSNLQRTIAWLSHVPEQDPPAGLWHAVNNRMGEVGNKTRLPRADVQRWQGWLAPAGAFAGGIALVLAGFAWITFSHQPPDASVGPLLAQSHANFVSQHLAMDRGEPLADTVAPGVMASLVEGDAAASSRRGK